jgi:hypothetical protein
MKKSDDPLPRLFRAAALASKEAPGSPPCNLEDRLIARWRKSESEDESALLVNLLRPALLLAGCIMVISLGWAWMQSSNENTAETALANYAMNIQLPP